MNKSVKKKLFKIVLITLGTLGLLFYLYVLFEHRALDLVIIENYDNIMMDSLVTIKIEPNFKVFIDNKYSNIDSWSSEIENACRNRPNDSILLLKIDQTIPQSFINEVLLAVKKEHKKVIIIPE